MAPALPRPSVMPGSWPLLPASRCHGFIRPALCLGFLLALPDSYAGDILRGGAAANVRQSDPSVGTALAAQRQARASQQDALAKTAQSLQAVRALQAQARALSARSGATNLGPDPNHPGRMLPEVPDGLGPGALQLLGAPAGAMAPVQAHSGGLTRVTVRQTAQQALLDWETFNIGRHTELRFDQSAGGANAAQWIAFNRIHDPSGRPSQILGSLQADGQVYVINQNGIIFGGSSQVNARTLVATSLPLNDNLIQRGLLNNPDSQFLLTALPVAAGARGTPAFTPPASALPDNRHGDVTVQAGAVISSPVSADGHGGRIMLAGANVHNAGSLVAPSGQVILAAGLQIGVDAHRSSDASLRGLDVYVGSTGTYGGTVTSSGLIEVMRGSASLSGKTIHHTGVIESSTSVSLNGRIDLTANYDAVPNTGYDPAVPSTGNPFLFQSTGQVTLGAGSLLRILPELASAEKTTGTELALRSQINLQGKTVYLGPGAGILAPNALVSVKAGGWHYVPGTTPPSSTFYASGGQVYLDRGAFINVAGSTGVTAPLSQVILKLVLRGGELAPSPLQRNGLLRGPELTVDLRHKGVHNGRAWIGTPLADLTGYAGLIERTAGELTVAGGSVEISAGGSVVMQPGSSVDVSGGHVEYLGGTVKTSRVWADGRLINIRDATPDRLYGGVFTGTSEEVHERWGIVRTWHLPLAPTGEHYEPPTLSGADAGRIGIAAPSQALDGRLTGLTSPGPRQLRDTGTTSSLPAGGTLELSFSGQTLLGNSITPHFPAPPGIVFDYRRQAPAGAFSLDSTGQPAALDESRRQTVHLSPDLTTTGGFGSIILNNSGGSILVPEGVELAGRAGGTFRFFGANIGIFGKVSAPGGTLAFEALNLTSYDSAHIRSLPEEQRNLPAPHPGRGLFTLGSGAMLDAAGLLVDDRLSHPAAFTRPAALAGGSVSIKGYAADLAPGSVIDVSGGVLADPFGRRTYGDAGSIVIEAGQDPGLKGLTGGALRLGSELRGYSGATGGSLAIQAPLVQVGGAALHPHSLVLHPEFFSQGGFGSFTLSGLGAEAADGSTLPAVLIAPGTETAPVSRSLVAELYPRGGGIRMRVVDKPAGLRTPVSLAFHALGIEDGIANGQLVRGDLVMGEGAVIRTDPLASVTLSGQTAAVLGSVYAPAGTIRISGRSNSTGLLFPDDETQALTTVYLGPRSVLSAAGIPLLFPDAFGRRTGLVLPGGSIQVSGNLVAAPGSVLDVSGTHGLLDLHPAAARPLAGYRIPAGSGLTEAPAALAVERVRLDSSGGEISLAGGQFLFSGATLRGHAGGPTAQGGVLRVSSGRFRGQNTGLDTDTNLVVTQSGPVLPSGPVLSSSLIGQPVPGVISRGYFAVESFTRGGFDSLSLGGKVEFQGPVTIDARGWLSVGDGGIIAANDLVTLRAPLIALGRLLEPARPEAENTRGFGTAFPPVHGPGRLIAEARHLDLGTLSLQGIGQASLTAWHGDIRGSGTVHLAGDLVLRAAQVYPATATSFNLIAYDYPDTGGVMRPGSVTIQGSGMVPLPLSAGGSLGVYASIIRQDGVLRAPFGSITLGWDGTGTAPKDLIAGSTLPFPVTRSVTLGAGSITSVSAVDPLTGRGLVIPYGVSPDGLTWIDPRGVDITAGGLPEKSITIAGQNVTFGSGAVIDLRGGGDLMAWRFVRGNGGQVDILASEESFAVVPGYYPDFAPFALFNPSDADTNLIRDYGPGYANSRLKAGDRIFLQGSRTLAAGHYTLLPARYALLPGAVLVTPQTRPPTGTHELPDGSSLVSGYAYNHLNAERTLPGQAMQFELASAPVVQARAQYETYAAGSFLGEAARRLSLPRPLLPADSGRLVFHGTQSMNLLGRVLSASLSGGRGSRIGISSPLDFVIGRDASATRPGTVTLGAPLLGSWQAESLIIGGRGSMDTDGNPLLTATTGSIVVDNAGAALSAADLILLSTGGITLAPGAELASSGQPAAAPDYRITGNGALVRISGNPLAGIRRTGATGTAGSLTAGAGASLRGGGITLDSTSAMTLDPAVRLNAESYTLNAGHITLALDGSGPLPPGPGLILTGPALDGLQTARSLSLLSYTTLDLYGSGTVGSPALQKLALNAGQIRQPGSSPAGGGIAFQAGEILLGNASGAPSGVATLPGSGGNGDVTFHAGTVRLTAGDLAFNGMNRVLLEASGGVIGEGTGRLDTAGTLEIRSPLLTGAAGSARTITAAGDLILSAPAAGSRTAAPADPAPGLGATLNLSGRSTTAGTTVLLPGGSLGLTATAGNLTVTGRLEVSGQARSFHDVVRYVNGGSIRLAATAGDVVLGPDSVVSVSAAPGGGDAGSLTVLNPQGTLTAGGVLSGNGGAGGRQGSFTLDTSRLETMSGLAAALTGAGFTDSQTFRVRTGDVTLDGLARARNFALSVDTGSLSVTGRIDASGATGGSVHLSAHGGLTVAAGAEITVAGRQSDHAGKGGQITLEAGTQREGTAGTGWLDLQSGAVLDLSVASLIPGSASTPGSSAWLGQFGGKLHLRAPRTAAGDDLHLHSIASTITGASSILAEGYRVYDLTDSGGAITPAVQTQIKDDGTAFLGTAGSASAHYAGITARLLAGNAGLEPLLVLAPGAELLNRTGNLTLGNASSTTLNDWDLSGYRFGPKGAAGVLTLRAAGDLVFHNTLSDGFTPFTGGATPPGANLQLWLGRLTAQNPLLPVNTQSHSYRLTAGADTGASSFRSLLADSGAAGSLILGKAGTSADARDNNVSPGDNALTSSVIPQRWQVIRTGSGDITITAARDVQLLNQLATIYSAGTAVADPSMGGTFDVRALVQPNLSGSGLGAWQQNYVMQFAMGGGNVSLEAGGDITRLTRNAAGQLVADSGLQLPGNWLYRRGTVDPSGAFAPGRLATETLSSAWWVDYTNFFQGIGALGGGHVTLTAGGNVRNVDAVAPTNLRVSKGTPENPLAADQTVLELGGGDVTVRAGGDIDAGVYYVERGRGTLSAGGSIVTNATRSINPAGSPAEAYSPETQLPTTLFAGRSVFDVSARGDVLLGPVANAFLMPAGIGNSIYYKSYFSTYGADSAVRVSSLGGDITFRTAATAYGSYADGQTLPSAQSLLYYWLQNKLVKQTTSASWAKPWLRLNEVTGGDLSRYLTSLVTVQPGRLEAAAFSGDINLSGRFNLSPSASGSLSLLAAGGLHALQPNGRIRLAGAGLTTTWGSSLINLSDASPLSLPGVLNPLGYTSAQAGGLTFLPDFFKGIDAVFAETGSASSVIQIKQALHAPGLLHAEDDEPARLYAGRGDVSGLLLYSPKQTRILAGRDVSDVSFHLQNNRPGDISLVTSGRDIIPANASSALRVAASRPGHVLNGNSVPLAGDLQIAGPGSLQVLAGRTLDLGTVPGNADGTGTGISSIGNARNPHLGFTGADLVAAAGLGFSTGLGGSGETVDFDRFISTWVKGPGGQAWLDELSGLMNGRSFDSLPREEQERVALEVFYRVLRDAGRSQATGTAGRNTAAAGGYASGYAAISSLFPRSGGSTGDILTRGRDIRTRNGGNISLLAPGGGITLANTAIGNPLAPPGIVTESGGSISIFAHGDVSVGVGRIFTLRGGNQIIWSSTGDIAAGSAPKTVQSAPPTRVLIDPQSGAVQTDLAGLATGGGIGVLATVAGVEPGDVDLIAPVGVVDAGDAGIRSSGNLTIAATQVLNAGNITVTGSSAGTPVTAVSTPSTGGLTAASRTAGAAARTAAEPSRPAPPAPAPAVEETPSLFSVEVIGYGGGEGGPADSGEDGEDEEEKERRRRAREAAGQEEAAASALLPAGEDADPAATEPASSP